MQVLISIQKLIEEDSNCAILKAFIIDCIISCTVKMCLHSGLLVKKKQCNQQHLELFLDKMCFRHGLSNLLLC